MNKETIILFDLDGTLIDSTQAILSGFYHSFQELNFEFKGKEEDIKNLIGYPLDIMYYNLGVPKDKLSSFVSSYKNHYRKISTSNTILLENAFEALKLASSFARLSVVTTKTRKYTIPLLEHLNINSFFEIVTGMENVNNPKPHPEPILITLEQMEYNQNTQNAFMIGDTKLDLISAKKANINSIGVLCGYGKKEELKKHSSIIKNNALEAVKYIKQNTNSKISQL